MNTSKFVGVCLTLLIATAGYESQKLWEISERLARVEQKLDDHIAAKHAATTNEYAAQLTASTLLQHR